MLVWWLVDEPALSAQARSTIADPENLVAVSAITALELTIKSGIGKINRIELIRDQLDRERFEKLAITHEHAWEAGALPLHHRDPFDRLLVAQARLEGLTIVTRDAALGAYDVVTLRA